MRDKADQQGECCSANQRRGRYRTDLQTVEAEAEQVDRQHHADEAVSKRAHAPGRQQHGRIEASRRWQPVPPQATADGSVNHDVRRIAASNYC